LYASGRCHAGCGAMRSNAAGQLGVVDSRIPR
jgi:hypothetical protein